MVEEEGEWKIHLKQERFVSRCKPRLELLCLTDELLTVDLP